VPLNNQSINHVLFVVFLFATAKHDVDTLNNIVSKKVFKCNANETVLNGNSTDNTATFKVTVSSLRLRAFQNTTKDDLDGVCKYSFDNVKSNADT